MMSFGLNRKVAELCILPQWKHGRSNVVFLGAASESVLVCNHSLGLNSQW